MLTHKDALSQANGAAPKHTPGPWMVGDLDHAGQRMVSGEHIEICTCWHHGVASIEREMEANARLIAAAPALLAELRSARKIVASMGEDLRVSAPGSVNASSFDDALRRMDGLISKAEGRS